MKSRVLVLGAGFGGMELSTLLSQALGEKGAVTLIDKGEDFVFGFSKLDLMFGRTTPQAAREGGGGGRGAPSPTQAPTRPTSW